MRLTINLATRPYYNQRRVTVLLLTLTLLAVLTLLLGMTYLTQTTRALQRLSNDIARLDERARAQHSDQRTDTAAQLQQRTATLSRLAAQQAGHTWLNLLNQLEHLTPAGISLSKLEPGSNSELTLEGSTRSFGELQHLLENLDKSGQFKETTLVSHNKRQDPELGRLVQFVIKSRIVTP